MLNQEEVNYEELDRRPRYLRYEMHARAIEEMIMDGLPEVIEKLMSMAKEGNVPAAKYLIDRIHGRPAKLSMAAVGDKSLPYNHQDRSADSVRWKAMRDDKAATAMRMLGHEYPPLKLGPKAPSGRGGGSQQGIPGVGKPGLRKDRKPHPSPLLGKERESDMPAQSCRHGTQN